MAAAIEGGGGGGGGTLSEVYHSAKKLLPRARDGIERLERLESTAAANGGLDSPKLSFAGEKDISLLHSLSADMDRLSRSIPSEPQRNLWKRKVEQVAEEAESLKESLDKYFLRNQRWMREAQERAELVGRAVYNLPLVQCIKKLNRALSLKASSSSHLMD